MENKLKLRWSDIWVLVSTCYCSPTDASFVHKVIGAADAINHAIINFEELSSALVRLSESGLITVETSPWTLECTKEGGNIFKKAAEKNSLTLKIWEEIENILEVEPWLPREPLPHPENNLTYPGFTKEIYTSEVNEYLKSMGTKNKPV